MRALWANQELNNLCHLRQIKWLEYVLMSLKIQTNQISIVSSVGKRKAKKKSRRSLLHSYAEARKLELALSF